MPKTKRSFDSIIEEFEESIKEKTKKQNPETAAKKIIGKVEQFYDKISVAAIKLEDSLDIGDIIEIGNEQEAIRQRVESIEMNRKSIEHAEIGDEIGIKLKWKVNKDDKVYKIAN